MNHLLDHDCHSSAQQTLLLTAFHPWRPSIPELCVELKAQFNLHCMAVVLTCTVVAPSLAKYLSYYFFNRARFICVKVNELISECNRAGSNGTS